ncbi:MAG: tRNA (N6-threonylcarbamoyladenosine(37)-N6)-methyltransferase TrmO [Gammaproteobacteria bacterium]|nr:tRNA (N6-threonylcarbamoyladenosine(37)-N6)-methyltransferase TrmO [Gammaproteobacteria bacterium]
MNDFNFKKVAIVRSCYKEKFGIPRQSGLSDHAEAIIELVAPYNHEDYIRELEGFSHLWLIFVFHKHLGRQAKATVRPPRLGGNKRVGVFASRSSFRPNPVGLSVVKLQSIRKQNNKIELSVSGADLVDGTPVIDIKPYIGYADSVTNSHAAYAQQRPEPVLAVKLSQQAKGFICNVKEQYPLLEKVIRETISLDPRPGYVDSEDKVYGLNLYDLNIKWTVEKGQAEVFFIESLAE